jgi:hypothetical protein
LKIILLPVVPLYNTFTGCTALTAINVHSENPSYASETGVLFNKNKTTLICYPAGKSENNYIIPNSVTSIEDNAIAACVSLTSITVPESVITIGFNFSYCLALTSINVNSENPNYSSATGVLFNKNKTTLICYPTGKPENDYIIPNGVTSIKELAFYYCTALTSVTIPESVTNIESWVFRSCTALSSITNLNPVPISIELDVFVDVNINDCTLKVPVNSVSDYQNAEVWKEFNIVGIDVGIEHIETDIIKIYPNPTIGELRITN